MQLPSLKICNCSPSLKKGCCINNKIDCHSRAGGNPSLIIDGTFIFIKNQRHILKWIPACAGMTIIRKACATSYCSFMQQRSLKKGARTVIKICFLMLFLINCASYAQDAPQSDAQPLYEFYALKETNPQQAEKVLENFIKQNPSNLTAQLEMGDLLIKENRHQEAIPYFKNAQKLDPSDYRAQLQLNYLLSEKQKSGMIFIKTPVVSPAEKTPAKNTPPAPPSLLDEFYKIKEKNPRKAEQILCKLLAQKPCDLKLLLEMGYLLVAQKRNSEAIFYFQNAERLDPKNGETTLQIAYLFNETKRNREAYYKFQQASYSPKKDIHLKGEEGMIGLAGQQTKVLKDPYFVDFYFAPFYLSRFRDYICPSQARAGITYGKNKQGELYVTNRFNRDTESLINNAIPQIYSDNSVDWAFGTNYQPFEKIPIQGYIELGRAYELVTNGDGRPWKYDFRLGVTGYSTYGAPPVYSECLAFPFKFVGDIYGDFSYYSRFVHDWIGQLRVRPGVRTMTYRNSSVDLYLNVNLLWDTQRLFYNNILVVGPGIAFQPDNRFNLIFRVESDWGYYLPININSSQPNPYNSIYYSTIVEMETYIRF
jgi:tetratricopeptide (TPR) repeat protein